jgi:uncharacterized phage protein (TIGR01671 family)
MREILFRGIAKSHGTFEFGDLITSMGKTYIGNTIGNNPDDWCEVIPETVGQFTGLTDKNGVKIFEGDILKSDFGNGEPFSIRFGDFFDEWAETHFVGFYTYPELNAFGKTIQGNTDAYQVIGNIHDNPELL